MFIIPLVLFATTLIPLNASAVEDNEVRKIKPCFASATAETKKIKCIELYQSYKDKRQMLIKEEMGQIKAYGSAIEKQREMSKGIVENEASR